MKKVIAILLSMVMIVNTVAISLTIGIDMGFRPKTAYALNHETSLNNLNYAEKKNSNEHLDFLSRCFSFFESSVLNSVIESESVEKAAIAEKISLPPKLEINGVFNKSYINIKDKKTRKLSVSAVSESEIASIKVVVVNSGKVVFEYENDGDKIKNLDIPLMAGTNIMTIVATDIEGVSTRKQITVDTIKENRKTLTAPTLELSKSNEDKVVLTWSNTNDKAAKYMVLRSENSGKYQVVAIGLNSLTFKDTSAVSGVSYKYVVTAYTDKLISNNSNEVLFKVSPKAPKLLLEKKDGEYILHFNKKAGVEWHDIYVLEDGEYTLYIAQVLGSSYIVEEFDGQEFAVVAKNSLGESSLSNSVKTGTSGEFNPNIDSDGDGLTDLEELVLSTNRFSYDTDIDGVSDGDEILFNFDPLNPDSNGDGIFDGAEVVLGESKENSLEINKVVLKKGATKENKTTVTVKGNKNLAITDIVAKEVESSVLDQIDGIVGKAVSFSSNNFGFNEAELSFSYTDEELLEKDVDEDSLAIFYLNTETNTFDKLESAVDKANKKVTAKTDHFSTFLLGDESLESDLSGVEVVFIVERQYNHMSESSYYHCNGHSESYCSGHVQVEQYCPGHTRPIYYYYFCQGHKVYFLGIYVRSDYCSGCSRTILGYNYNYCQNDYDSLCSTKTVTYSCYGCQTRTTYCSGCCYHPAEYSTATFAANNLERKIIEKLTDTFADNQLKVGVGDNTGSSVSQAATRDVTSIATASNATASTYSNSTRGASLEKANALFTNEATVKIVNYIRLYGDAVTLKNQVINQYNTITS